MSDRRSYKRYPAAGVCGTIRITSDGREIPVEFIDFSRGGAAVKLAPECSIQPEANLKLVVDNIEVGGKTIARMSDSQGCVQIKIRFDYSDSRNVDSATLLENVLEGRIAAPAESFPEEESTIADDDRIGQILASYLFYRKGKIYVWDDNRKPLGNGTATNDGRHIVILFNEPHDFCSNQVLHFSFNGYISYYTFKERVTEVGSRTLTVPRPLVLTRKRSRRLPRFRNADLDAYVLCPWDGKTFLDAGVVDISFNGIAMVLDTPQEEFQPEDKIEKIVVQLPGCGEVQFSGIVKYAGGIPGHEATKIGVSTTSFFRGCEKVWNRYIYNRLLPSLEGEGFDFQSLEYFSLLKDANYLSLCGRKVNYYEPIAPSFADYHVLTGKVRDEKLNLFHFGDSFMGILAKNRLYSSTFLLHHLAVRRESEGPPFTKEHIAREIYMGTFLDAYLTEDLHYCVFYFSAGKKWNKFMYDDFLCGMPNASLFFSGYYSFLEFDLSSQNEIGLRSGQEKVKNADGRVLTAVSDFLRKHAPALMFEAYDYSADRIDLAPYNRVMGGRISRDRRVFYCQRFGEITGVALAESTSHTLNLFNIGDSVRIFARSDLPEDERREIKTALLIKTIYYFASLCKPYFMYFCYEDDVGNAQRLGFRKVDDSRELIMTKELLPSYIDFVEMVLSAIGTGKGA